METWPELTRGGGCRSRLLSRFRSSSANSCRGIGTLVRRVRRPSPALAAHSRHWSMFHSGRINGIATRAAGVTITAGTPITAHPPHRSERAPSSTRLPPRVSDGEAVCRMRSNARATLSRSSARRVLYWSAFPLAPALRSTGSAAGRPALFVGFIAVMAGSDFSRPYIIGYGSSPSRCGPARRAAADQARDLRGSDAVPSCVTGSSTTAERQRLA